MVILVLLLGQLVGDGVVQVYFFGIVGCVDDVFQFGQIDVVDQMFYWFD